MKLFGRHYGTGRALCLDIAAGKVLRATQPASDVRGVEQWPWIAPGLFDIQINGYGGQEFGSADLTMDKVVEITRSVVTFGVTSYCPTVTTESFEVLQHAVRTIGEACEAFPDVARRIAGIHVEGPYITPQDGPRGAHPLEHVRRPDWDEFQRLQEAAGGRIRIFTMSVEFDESPEFVRRVVKTGVIVSIGHTAAAPRQIRRAVDAGAQLSTHLGNGSHPKLHRFRNYIWQQLADDRLMASIIVDGHHLPSAVVKTFVRAKGPERCILVSDISGQAGRPPGRYKSDFCDVEVLPEGKLVVAGQRELLAGAALPIGTGVATVMRFAGVDLETAVRMAVHNPADLLDMDPGGLEPGDPANLVQFHLADPEDGAAERFQVSCTVADGNVLFGVPWQPSLKRNAKRNGSTKRGVSETLTPFDQGS